MTHVDGEYDAESDTNAIRLTKGYSRDHRPRFKSSYSEPHY